MLHFVNIYRDNFGNFFFSSLKQNFYKQNYIYKYNSGKYI